MLRRSRYQRMLEANPHLAEEDLVQEFVEHLLANNRASSKLAAIALDVTSDPDFDLDTALNGMCQDYLTKIHQSRTVLGRVRRSLVDAVGSNAPDAAVIRKADGTIRLAAWSTVENDKQPATREDVARLVGNWQLDRTFAQVATDDDLDSRGRSWFQGDRNGNRTIADAIAALLAVVASPVLINDLAASITRHLNCPDVDLDATGRELPSTGGDPSDIVAMKDLRQRIVAGASEVDLFVIDHWLDPPADQLTAFEERFGKRYSLSWLQKRRQQVGLRVRAAAGAEDSTDGGPHGRP